jgi:drug/metabolite transporter (DMT)-like permease
MIAVVVGVTSALIFGAADFLGGLGSKRIAAIRVTAIAAAAGLVLLLAGLLIVPSVWSPTAIWLGALSGVTGAVAISLLYACLAIGPMSILSPLTAVVSAIVPLSVGIATGDNLTWLDAVALGLALIAVVLVGFVPEKGAVRPSLKGLLMAIGSGIAIGLFLVIISATPTDSGLVPLVMNRAVNALIMLAVIAVIALRGQRDARGWRTGLPFAIACGIVDSFANGGLLLGLRLGELSVMSVLTALYPAGTIILAAIVLKERIAPVQYVGLVLAISAAALLALG